MATLMEAQGERDDTRWLERFVSRRWEAEARADFIEQRRQGTARALRALRFADTIISALGPFLPSDKVIVEMVWDRLVESAFVANAEIIQVPREWDYLRKTELELAMIARSHHIVTEILTQEIRNVGRLQALNEPKPDNG